MRTEFSRDCFAKHMQRVFVTDYGTEGHHDYFMTHSCTAVAKRLAGDPILSKDERWRTSWNQ